ncbi:hypothetical protein GXW78_22865 [Roseomonas terrae]|jgi:hypothetical protein|uniref:Outer membrane protein assembly factor BamE n=1 Tax=Neoroseomonas terrae TaxID=424799 RepID=A0ABS5ENB7_9PROT|nr:hypothetical protein [Neoroseomonas terrae]MBR0652516.1 hypothetical protein [Neoroseomonas terrae]
MDAESLFCARRRRGGPWQGLWLSLLLLPGCAGGDEEATALLQHALASTQASLALSGAAAPAPPAMAPHPAGTQAPAAIRPGAAPSLAAATPLVHAPGAARLRGSAPPAAAAALMGLSADQLRRMLGDPSIRRPEGDAEVWLYEAPTCRLDVILYGEGTALTVGHAAARALGGGEGVTEGACLSAIAGASAPALWTTQGPRA